MTEKVRVHYYIKLGLVGFAEPRVYEVEEADHIRLKRLCDLDEEHSDVTFLGFDVPPTGCTVIVNLHAIKYAQLLVEGGATEPDSVSDGLTEAGHALTLYFIGEPNPMEATLDEPGELFDLEGKLEEAYSRGLLFSWTDEDGEDFFVNPEHLALIEAPTWLLQDPMSAEEDQNRPDTPEEAD